MKRFFFSVGLLVSHAALAEVQPFVVGSYQKLLEQQAGKAFVLAIWSVDCPSCIKDMAVLREFHAQYPQLPLLLLSTDEPAARPQVEKLLRDQQLEGLPNWQFADEDAQKLRYEIDPSWFGELPKTYFFNQEHLRVGKSGALGKQQLIELARP